MVNFKINKYNDTDSKIRKAINRIGPERIGFIQRKYYC